MSRKTRPISWIKAALKEFEAFPEGARSICLAAPTIAAKGGKADVAKPVHGFGSGVFEIALPFQGDAFQKKSTRGIQTPRREISLIQDRLKRLKEMLR
jgi:phage-related protein